MRALRMTGRVLKSYVLVLVVGRSDHSTVSQGIWQLAVVGWTGSRVGEEGTPLQQYGVSPCA